MSKMLYQLNVFGKYWPEHGKKIYRNRKAVDNRVRALQDAVRYKYADQVNEDILESNIEYGYSIVAIDPLIRTDWAKLYGETKFYKNTYRIGDDEFDD